ncbi:uncharacterized protein LOC127001544 [Eriocheir sinensis]|uniref:uncharacterized protein LOC127001544 n=1 Tax=Eriocheir sinensis TaxID=95602 RepID=UPI0021C5EEB6|nr:uncharacterized protein LOC127001544 [Eriocheir sinensis]
MSPTGLLSLLLLVAMTTQKAAAADDPTTTTTTTTTEGPAAAPSLAIKKADLVAEIMAATNNLQDILPDNSLTISVESVGFFLLLAGVVAFLIHFIIGFGKAAPPPPAAELYSYPTGPATYSTGAAPGSGYGPGYSQEEAYNVHRNLEQAAAKYQ